MWKNPRNPSAKSKRPDVFFFKCIVDERWLTSGGLALISPYTISIWPALFNRRSARFDSYPNPTLDFSKSSRYSTYILLRWRNLHMKSWNDGASKSRCEAASWVHLISPIVRTVSSTHGGGTFYYVSRSTLVSIVCYILFISNFHHAYFSMHIAMHTSKQKRAQKVKKKF